MKRRLTLLAALSVAAIGMVGATQAQAQTYCANKPATPACSTNFTTTATAVQQAVAAAQTNPGPDTVLIGQGTFTATTAMQLYSTGANNAVAITGEGTLSVLSVNNANLNPMIDFDAGNGSTMSNLSLSLPADMIANAKTGLKVQNSSGGTPPIVDNVSINVMGSPTNLTGVSLQDGASLMNSAIVTASPNYNRGVATTGAGDKKIVNTFINAQDAIENLTTSGSLTISRSRTYSAKPGSIGVQNEGGTLNLNDSWVRLPASGIGIRTTTSSGFGDTRINGSTITGGSFATGTLTQAEGAPDSSSRLQLDNTVLATGGINIDYYGGNGGNTVTVNAIHSAYDTGKIEASNISTLGTFAYNPQNVVNLGATSPGFVDAANDDFHLTPTSPLVDAGQPIDPPAGAVDLDGNPRACQGNGSGLIVRDIGAYEYRVDLNDFCEQPVSLIYPAPGSRNTDTTPTFNLDSNRFGATFVCSIDGGPYSACADPYTTPVLSVGTHTLRVKATDQFGNLQLVPDEKSFTILAASCANTPSLCPTKDETKPVVKGLKAPKKTKAKKVKVKFRSNEAGSTFKCKLNKGKAKKCKSPWKTPNLKKGANTVTVVAIDRAGNFSKPAKVKIRRKN